VCAPHFEKYSLVNTCLEYWFPGIAHAIAGNGYSEDNTIPYLSTPQYSHNWTAGNTLNTKVMGVLTLVLRSLVGRRFTLCKRF